MIALRPACAADVEALAGLCAQTIAKPWSGRAFEAEIAAGAFLPTAWEGDRLVGFAALRAEDDLGYLSLLAVDPDYRRRGIASALMSAAEDWCRRQGLTRVLLDVRASNEGARSFYFTQNYVCIARRPAFYDFPREDGLTMQKELS